MTGATQHPTQTSLISRRQTLPGPDPSEEAHGLLSLAPRTHRPTAGGIRSLTPPLEPDVARGQPGESGDRRAA